MDPLQKQRTPACDPSESARSDPFPPGTTIARYRLVSLIGSGAMGDVYRAHDRALDREVALKVLPPELTGDRERVHRFAQEARATSALSHPHIVAIHEVGHARPLVSVRAIGERPARGGEVHYIAMELIEGATLRERFASTPPLRERVALLAQVADGLAKAHAANILHRDLKPDNILVSRDGYAKIVDFGLAKLIDSSWNPIGADSPTLRALTAHGELLGTPGYMAPEQVTGKPLDARADIFAFGCILYEAVSGARAFEAESFVDTLYKIVHEDPAPLLDVPPHLAQIVERCLAKDRDHRYQSIREVATDLRAWNAGVPPAGPAPSRRRLAIASLIALLPILAFLFLKRPAQPPQTEPTVRRVTSDGRATFTAISPDARYVAYVTSDPKGSTLSLEQLATSRTLVIAPAGPAHYTGVTFSPDGEYLYFTRYDTMPLGVLYRVPLLGGEAQPLVRDVDTGASLSPDGRHVAFARDDYNKGTTALITANADGTNERALATFPMPDRLGAPSWSPGGGAIAAARQSVLVVVAYPGGKSRTIETSAHLDAFRGVAWTERDRIVASATTDDSAGRYRLWSIDPSNGETNAMTSELADFYAPSVSNSGAIAALQVIRQANLFESDASGSVRQLTSGIDAANGLTGVAWTGDRIVYASTADGKPDLQLMQKDGAITRLTDDAAYESKPATTPDGSAIVYVSGSAQRHAIWSVRPDGTERRQLTSGPRDGDFAISPDSKQLAWASLDTRTNTWGLWTMPLAGGAKKRIATSASVLEEIRYTPDGASILFTGYDTSMLRVYRVAASGGRATSLTDHRARDPIVSPDGRTIACSYTTGDSLKTTLALIDTRSGRLTALDVQGSMFRWLDGRTISFAAEENGVENLWLYSLDSRTTRRLTHFSEGSIYDYAWNASGTRAAIAHVVDSSDVVLMK
jgi:serine/threonine protein kinase/Tol biopolymer transport system component